MLSKEQAQYFSKRLKIDLFTIYREYLQLLFLKYFYSQKETEQVFLKGGTALRFLFDSFRFSEDLDFTSLIKEKKIKEIINKTLSDLEKEIPNLSFKEEETIANSFTGRVFQELEEFKFPLTIRLDFSLREEPYQTTLSLIESEFPIGPYPQVAHLKAEEMLAEKIRAILTRKRGRDIFDLWFLLSKKVSIDWNLVNKKMALYNRKTDLEELIERIESLSQKEIEEDLTKFLPLSHRNLVGKIKNLALEKLKAL